MGNRILAKVAPPSCNPGVARVGTLSWAASPAPAAIVASILPCPGGGLVPQGVREVGYVVLAGFAVRAGGTYRIPASHVQRMERGELPAAIAADARAPLVSVES